MTEFRRQKGTFSIPDGQLTSALSPKLHFPQILSAKYYVPLPCSPISPERSRVFPIAWTPPLDEPLLSVGRGDLSIPAVRLSCPVTPLNAQRLLQGMVFLFSLLQYKISANITDLTRGIV